MVADAAPVRSVLLGIEVRDFLQACRQHGAVAIEGHDVGNVGGQFVVDGHFTSAGLVQHGHFHAVAEGGSAFHQDAVHVLNEGVVADVIVGDVVLYVFDAAIVSHRYVVQGHVAQGGVLLDAAGQGEFSFEHAQADVAAEARMVHMVGGEAFGHTHSLPVVGQAGLGLQAGDLVFV